MCMITCIVYSHTLTPSHTHPHTLTHTHTRFTANIVTVMVHQEADGRCPQIPLQVARARGTMKWMEMYRGSHLDEERGGH